MGFLTKRHCKPSPTKYFFLFFHKGTIDRLKMVQYLSVLKKYMQLQVPLPVKFSENKPSIIWSNDNNSFRTLYSNIN
jgi:hypothetical protein